MILELRHSLSCKYRYSNPNICEHLKTKQLSKYRTNWNSLENGVAFIDC